MGRALGGPSLAAAPGAVVSRLVCAAIGASRDENVHPATTARTRATRINKLGCCKVMLGGSRVT